jgi:hypothetical protein
VRALRRLSAFLRDEDRRYLLATATAGIVLSFWIRESGERIHRLESRGWTPVDDLVTIGDLVRLEERLSGDALPPTAEEGQADRPAP